MAKMKSYYNNDVAQLLNDLMNLCFQLNLRADNIAYQLATTLGEDGVSEIFHPNVAHFFTGDLAADYISDVMIKSNIQPKRTPLVGDDVVYKNIAEAFNGSVLLFEELRKTTISVIDGLEYDITNKQLVNKMEDFLGAVVDELRKANIVATKAEEYVRTDRAYEFEGWYKEFVGQ